MILFPYMWIVYNIWWGTAMWGISYLRLDSLHNLSLFGMFLLSSFLLNLSDQAKPRYVTYNCLSSISYSWRSWNCWDIELFRKMIRQGAVTVQIQVTWLSTPLSSPRFLRVCYFSRHSFYVHGSWRHFICNPAEHETREWWDNKQTLPRAMSMSFFMLANLYVLPKK